MKNDATKDDKNPSREPVEQKDKKALAGAFKRLSNEQLKRLAKMANAEVALRDGEDVAGMDEATFRAHVDKLLSRSKSDTKDDK